ncbi:S46 family peptidase [Sphingomonas sp. LY29]|uniref:S46 family peptidase n=1 Tax=Sphingomonas sp. LY29 TaxID=3095341 RepID=UPI002D773064|nr:S46 family peptidase [Sphingomonas sp. LY29]WRP24816.1 S46 family peptidase [Sphingomonas sp. LY29]
MSRLALFLAGISLPLAAAKADEGMWTFDAFPAAKFRDAYGWSPDQAWLDRVRLASVKVAGCSSAFVSSNGLLLTNHHCAVSCLQDVSDKGNDFLANGFTARATAQEKMCPGMQAEVVTAIRDVTGDVKSAIGGATGEAAVKARNAAIAAIEKAGCADTKTTRCQVVTLYGGGQYKLYTNRKYSDVRLVWAPEAAAQTFGGDPDNYNFPRYALDASFLRAYENGRPVATPNHLKWTAREPKAGEQIFVVGYPGQTERMLTLSQFAFQREVNLPIELAINSELRGRLIEAMGQSPDKAREGEVALFGIENNLKRTIGRTRALGDPAFSAMLARNEAELKQRSAGNAAIGDPWGEIDKAVAALRTIDTERRFSRPSGDLMSYAIRLVRAGEERAKPNGERLPGYNDSALPLLEKQLTDARPTYPWLEKLRVEWSLLKAREYLGADHAQTRLLIGKESPKGIAERLVSGTRLGDAAVRKALWDGGAAAIAASTDPMIVYARAIDANDRRLQKAYDERVDGPLTAARAKLADARFAAFGASSYPDATGTLRITYGKVGGWTENGATTDYRTRWAGAFDRATGSEPFKLAPAILANKGKLNFDGTLDFIYAADTIGGNSGSPVIDRNANIIGANFDRNLPGLRNDYAYDLTMARSIAVSTAAIEQALTKVYPAPELLAELKRK